jgi:CubicO group peptidase (beta-lactamase class C family)
MLSLSALSRFVCTPLFLLFLIACGPGEVLDIPENKGITPPLRPDRIFPGQAWAQADVTDGSGRFAQLHEFLFTRTGDETDRRGIRTDGVVIVHRGRIVYEAYGRGYHKDMPHHAWSIAKVATSALVGVGVRKGLVTLDDELARFYPELRDDPRGRIKIRHLLFYGSGLDWNEGYEFFPLTSSILAMLYATPAVDVERYILGHEVTGEPGAGIAYQGADPTLLMAVLKRTMTARDYDDFPWRELFEPLGITSAVFGRGGQGVYIGSTSLYMTPRDLARFGYLYLADGVWDGERILPEGWVKFSTSLAPAYYTADSLLVRFIGVGIGAQWWLNSGNPRAGGKQAWPAAPRDAFASTGHWGQRLIVIPSRDLVVVRFGDEKFGGFASNRFLELVLDALPDEDPTEGGR